MVGSIKIVASPRKKKTLLLVPFATTGNFLDNTMAATEAVPNKADSSTAESEHQESKQVIEWSSETKQVSLRTKLEEAEKAHDASAAGWEWPEWATAPAWPSRDLARFLIARQGDETKSLRMLVRHIQWRVQECPWFPHSLPPLQPVHSALSSGKVWVAGRTKQGFPLAWVKAQHHVVADTTPEQSEALVTFVIEQLVRAACVPSQTTSESNEEATVQLPGKFVAVVDMAEYGYANLDTGIVKTLLATLSRNFPERMYRIYIFNEG